MNSNNFKNQSYDRNQYIIDLIYKNIRLTYENRELKKMIEELQMSNKVYAAYKLIKEDDDYVVIRVKKGKERFLN